MPTAPNTQNKPDTTPETGIRERFSALDVDALLDENEVAEITGLATATLKTWRYLGRGPDFVRLGRACRYRVGTLREWIAEAGNAAA